MKSFLKYPLLILLTLTFGLKAFAQAPLVTAKIDSPVIKIGQQTLLHFFIHGPRNAPIGYPALKDSLTSKVLIVRPDKTDTVTDSNEPGQQIIRRNYVITSFDEGSYTIPPVKFKIGNDTVATEPITLEVKTVKVDTTKAIYDIKQPLTVSYTLWDWLRDNWPFVVIPMLIIALIAGIILYLKNRKKKEPIILAPPKPAVPPHIATINRLNELRDKKLWQMDFIKEYHVELTDIIRDYLTIRFGINALEKTTDEILTALRHNLDQADYTRLQQMFVLADLVKFAKAQPVAAENEQSMDNAIAFVRSVQPKVEPPKQEGGAADGVV